MKKISKGRHKKRPELLKFTIIILFCIVCIAFGYWILELFFGRVPTEISETAPKTVEQNISSPKKNDEILTIEEIVKYKPNNIESKNVEVAKSAENSKIVDGTEISDQNLDVNATNEISGIEGVNSQTNEKIFIKPRSKKPKLAIIIDDMSNENDAKNLKAVGLKLTPSFFPRSKFTPHTPQIAKNFKHFMIHLPLEALNYKDELDTILIGDSVLHMEAKIRSIRSDFPNARFINNHTGSKFTSNKKAMERLYNVLSIYNFDFVDSLTVGNSKVQKVAQNCGKRYIYRDIFLDNIQNVAEIRKMLKKAVKAAHEKGFAIAIGHPKKETFKALGTSDDILGDVEIVYVDEIYEYYK